MSDETDWNAKIIEEFRANGGKLGGMFEGADILLLHHMGSKTGVERVSPLGFQRVGSAYAVFGSNSGKTSDPHWVQNLRTHPRTTAEIGTDTVEVVARVAEGDERTETAEGEHPAVRRVRDDGEP
jgi:deazaflavin-dependent oxidoreductase (nitroreductase family)